MFNKPKQDGAEGERLLELGNFAQAEAFFLPLLEQLEARPGRKERRAKILIALATARWRQDKLDSAKEAGSAALPLLEGEAEKAERVGCLDLLARIALSQKDPASAIGYLEEALTAQREVRPVDQAAIIAHSRRLAAVYRDQSQWEQARAHIRETLDIARRECGENHKLTADCLAEFGRIQAECGEGAEGKAALEQAIEVHSSFYGSDSEEVARDYCLLAEICRLTENLESAVCHYERALRIREGQLGGDSAEFAALLMSLATVYLLSGRTEDSVASLKRARRIWEAAPEQRQERLAANTELFNTVSSYLGAKEAAALMASIGPAAEEGVSQTAALAAESAHTSALRGWEDLSFDFLPRG